MADHKEELNVQFLASTEFQARVAMLSAWSALRQGQEEHDLYSWFVSWVLDQGSGYAQSKIIATST